jgi:hypothetical protein
MCIICVVTIQLQTTLCANQCRCQQIEQEKALPLQLALSGRCQQIEQEKALPLQLALSVKMSGPSARLSNIPHASSPNRHRTYYDPIGRSPRNHHSVSLLALASLCLPKMNKCDSRTVRSLPTRLSSYIECRERLGGNCPEARPETGARVCPPILLHRLHPAGDCCAHLHPKHVFIM